MSKWFKDLDLKIKWAFEDVIDWIKDNEKVLLIILGSLAGLGLILFLIFGVACRGYNPDRDAIRMGVTSQNLLYTQYDDVVEILEEKGFTNIKTIESSGYFFTTTGETYKISIDGCENFYEYSKFCPDDLVLIYYYK